MMSMSALLLACPSLVMALNTENKAQNLLSSRARMERSATTQNDDYQIGKLRTAEATHTPKLAIALHGVDNDLADLDYGNNVSVSVEKWAQEIENNPTFVDFSFQPESWEEYWEKIQQHRVFDADAWRAHKEAVFQKLKSETNPYKKELEKREAQVQEVLKKLAHIDLSFYGRYGAAISDIKGRSAQVEEVTRALELIQSHGKSLVARYQALGLYVDRERMIVQSLDALEHKETQLDWLNIVNQQMTMVQERLTAAEVKLSEIQIAFEQLMPVSNEESLYVNLGDLSSIVDKSESQISSTILNEINNELDLESKAVYVNEKHMGNNRLQVPSVAKQGSEHDSTSAQSKL